MVLLSIPEVEQQQQQHHLLLLKEGRDQVDPWMKEETRHRQSFDNNYNGTAVKDKRTGLVQLASKRLMSLFLVKNKGLRCPLCCWLGELAEASQ